MYLPKRSFTLSANAFMAYVYLLSQIQDSFSANINASVGRKLLSEIVDNVDDAINELVSGRFIDLNGSKFWTISESD